jgi:glutathione S-transferase
METTNRLELLGAPGSPYTRKMIALLRYRHIPHAIIWGGHQSPPHGYPVPKVKLLPTVYFKDASGETEAVVDSTPIIRRLEREQTDRSVLPPSGFLGLLNDLIEDFADEWLTKAMFHYRWYHEADRKNAGPLLLFWSAPMADDATAQRMSAFFTKRQFERLYVVGSNDVTARTIEESYARFVTVLDQVIGSSGFVLGKRPSSADFAIYGQLTQLAIIEPTSAAVTQRLSQRVRAWVDRVEDFSGAKPADEDWLSPQEAGAQLRPLLSEIGRVYAPFLLANAAAVSAGKADFETEIDGRAWTQPTFPYQAKCLQWLRETYAALPAADRALADAAFKGTGCEAMFSS